MKTNISLIGLVASAAILFTGCSDDEKMPDFPGNPNPIVFTGDNSATFKITQTPVSTIQTVEWSIGVKSNKAPKSDVRVTMGIDNSLIAAYNAEHKTNYQAVPAGVVVFENQVMTIPAGERESVEETKMKLTEDSELLASLNSTDGYLVPVTVTGVEGAQLAVSRSSVSYIALPIVFDNVQQGVGIEAATGTAVNDHTGWFCNTNIEGFDASTFVDGDPATYTTSYNSDIELVVDMGREYNFDAIEACYQEPWGQKLIRGSLSEGTDISISSDSKSWVTVGTVKSGTFKYGTQFVVLYAPIKARYIRLNIPNKFQCGSINIYETK
ncbi:DUF1735 domain-containing protein [uncultured Muribaculum sp.]|uniref:BT_3987 domain-containing protein n=1 Tax=uncultured Muribaculum sp. TaxID=1918613 RepID=UPI0025FF9204|nr:DUF1735 domain-containing protein [uncultured Muribaculum sp.]